MSKEALKEKIRTKQNGKCSITAEKLAKETCLFDTDRILPKAKGGIYTDENSRGLSPRAHMERHHILKVRTPELTGLKVLIAGESKSGSF